MLWKIYISILFNFPYSDLKYSVSALAKACVYVCTAPAELSSWNEVKESSGLESERMTCSLNTLRTIYLLSQWLSGSTPHPSCVQPSQDPFAIAAGRFLAGEIRHRPKSSIPIMEDISSSGNSCFLSCVSCSDGGWSIECWLNDFTHSSDSRCSRWKALDWILLMLFILRSLGRENRVEHQYQSINRCKNFEGTQGPVRLQMLGTHFSWGDPSSGAGSNVQRDVRGLGRVVGGQEGGEGDVEREFSPMNHFWAAAISSLSRWLSFPDVSFYLHWDLTPRSPFKWISVPSSVLLFQVSQETTFCFCS